MIIISIICVLIIIILLLYYSYICLSTDNIKREKKIKLLNGIYTLEPFCASNIKQTITLLMLNDKIGISVGGEIFHLNRKTKILIDHPEYLVFDLEFNQIENKYEPEISKTLDDLFAKLFDDCVFKYNYYNSSLDICMCKSKYFDESDMEIKISFIKAT